MSRPPSHTPRNEPTWWARKTKPPSMDMCCTPKTCATIAFVGGTVESHRKPMTAAKTYTLMAEIGSRMKAVIATARRK